MQISMYSVSVRFVSDAKGPLEDKPGRVLVTLARNPEEASQRARAHYYDEERIGITIEYGDVNQLSDSFAMKSLVRC